MANKIPCEIIKDLLPSYMDGLTNEVTNDAVEEHVENCEGCRNALYAMKTPIESEAELEEKHKEQQEEKQEIDFLKKNRKRNKRIAIGSVIAAVLIVFVAIFSNAFLISEPVDAYIVYCKTEVNNRQVHIEGHLLEDEQTVTKIHFEDEDGIVCIQLEAVKSGVKKNLYGFENGEFSCSYKAQQPVSQVWFGNRIIWDQGIEIQEQVSRIYQTKHSYIGDMSANAKTAQALGVDLTFGNFTNELQTGEEPYRWTLIFERQYSAEQSIDVCDQARRYAAVLLAVIDNLEEVEFQFTTAEDAWGYLFSKEDINTYLGCADMKIYGTSPSGLQKMMEQLGLLKTDNAGSYANSENIRLDINNKTTDEYGILAVELDWFVDGQNIGGMGGGNADETALEEGVALSFFLEQQDFSNVVLTTDSEIVIQASVQDMNGQTHPVKTTISIPPYYGYSYEIVLFGNAEDGYMMILE